MSYCRVTPKHTGVPGVALPAGCWLPVTNQSSNAADVMFGCTRYQRCCRALGSPESMIKYTIFLIPLFVFQ